MKIIDLEGTYAGQLNKPANRIVLEHFAADKNKEDDESTRIKKFIRLFLWLVEVLKDTPAWNKPKTNIMIRKIKEQLEATIAGARRNKSSSYAVAGKLLNTIDHCRKMDVEESAERKANPGVPADLEQFETHLKALLNVDLEQNNLHK